MMRIRKMNTWKMAVGCLICVILFTPIFSPVFHVSEKQIALSVIDMLEDCMSERKVNFFRTDFTVLQQPLSQRQPQ